MSGRLGMAVWQSAVKKHGFDYGVATAVRWPTTDKHHDSAVLIHCKLSCPLLKFNPISPYSIAAYPARKSAEGVFFCTNKIKIALLAPKALTTHSSPGIDT